MPVQLVQTGADLKLAPEIEAAIKSVKLPGVRDTGTQLAKYDAASVFPTCAEYFDVLRAIPSKSNRIQPDSAATYHPAIGAAAILRIPPTSVTGPEPASNFSPQ
jgi:hypothetical protein